MAQKESGWLEAIKRLFKVTSPNLRSLQNCYLV
jgi:hypothetical protein